jgi:L-amino acid N-acyltransferase YncA
MPLAREPALVTVTAMTADHWPGVASVYAEGIATGHATFETEPPTWKAFDTAKLQDHRLVALDPEGGMLGWAAVSPVSVRAFYAGVVEHSVYVAEAAQGTGLGRRLLEALITSTEQAGIWTIQAGIFPENTGSIALHEQVGFREVGVRRRLGRMSHGPLDGHWRDVVLLERRSTVAGV